MSNRKASKKTWWICKLCGIKFDTELGAESCYNTHVPKEDLNISRLAMYEDGAQYEPSRRFPSIIEVRDRDTDSKELYILAKVWKQSSTETASVPGRGVRLDD